MSFPEQPLIKDENGITRFLRNSIVRYLLDAGPYDLDKLTDIRLFREKDWRQFYQLIGTSLDGFGELTWKDENAGPPYQDSVSELKARVEKLEKAVEALKFPVQSRLTRKKEAARVAKEPV